MFRILYTCIDVVASAVFLLPLFALYHRLLFHKVQHTALHLLFACYLAAVLSLTGIPHVASLVVDCSIQPIPFAGMLAELGSTLLNILLFLPMGFLAPILSPACRSAKRTALLCLAATCTIELLQLFTFRTTDINDILANTLGGMLGYCIARAATRRFSRHVLADTKAGALYAACLTPLLVMFFAAPPLADLLWRFLSG